MVVRSFYTIFVVLPVNSLVVLCLFATFSAAAYSTQQITIEQKTEQKIEKLERIRTSVKNFLVQNYNTGTQSADDSAMAKEKSHSAQITLGRLDPRLKLKKCDKKLTHQLMDNGNRGGNITVKTRCSGPSPWSIFITAKVDIFVPIATARHSLKRDTLIKERDIEIQNINVSTLGSGYVTDANRIIGKQLKRTLKPGDPIRLPLLSDPKAIKRGDTLVVEASNGSVSVVTSATALSDGRVGQQIRVKNTRSERVIRARVVGPGRVQVLL